MEIDPPSKTSQATPQTANRATSQAANRAISQTPATTQVPFKATVQSSTQAPASKTPTVGSDHQSPSLVRRFFKKTMRNTPVPNRSAIQQPTPSRKVFGYSDDDTETEKEVQGKKVAADKIKNKDTAVRSKKQPSTSNKRPKRYLSDRSNDRTDQGASARTRTPSSGRSRPSDPPVSNTGAPRSSGGKRDVEAGALVTPTTNYMSRYGSQAVKSSGNNQKEVRFESPIASVPPASFTTPDTRDKKYLYLEKSKSLPRKNTLFSSSSDSDF